jgi:hypothetical protein
MLWAFSPCFPLMLRTSFGIGKSPSAIVRPQGKQVDAATGGIPMSFRKYQSKQQRRVEPQQHDGELHRRRILEEVNKQINLNAGDFVDAEMMSHFGGLLGPVVIDLAMIDDALGGYENRVAIYKAVEARILSDPRCKRLWQIVRNHGEEPSYDFHTFCFNAASVSADVKRGKIPRPETIDEWVNALADEFSNNCGALDKCANDR